MFGLILNRSRCSLFVKRNLSFSLPSPRKLDQVTSVEKLQQEPPETIKLIWQGYHLEKKDAHADAMSGADHSTLMTRAKSCPMFIYPVFKDGGFMWMLSQFQENFFILTYLEEYKRNPSTASPWLSLHVYPDLIPTKDICLFRSDFLPNLDKESAQLLSKMIVTSYTDPTDKFYRHVRTFNKDPNSFDIDGCLETFKTISLQGGQEETGAVLS